VELDSIDEEAGEGCAGCAEVTIGAGEGATDAFGVGVG